MSVQKNKVVVYEFPFFSNHDSSIEGRTPPVHLEFDPVSENTLEFSMELLELDNTPDIVDFSPINLLDNERKSTQLAILHFLILEYVGGPIETKEASLVRELFPWGIPVREGNTLCSLWTKTGKKRVLSRFLLNSSSPRHPSGELYKALFSSRDECMVHHYEEAPLEEEDEYVFRSMVVDYQKQRNLTYEVTMRGFRNSLERVTAPFDFAAELAIIKSYLEKWSVETPWATIRTLLK